MRKKNKAGANLFFIEFIITLFFFLIVSTICIRVFVHSHIVTQNAEALSYAQTISSSIAEVIEGSEDPVKDLPVFFPEIQNENDSFFLTYDKNFQLCDAADAFYSVVVAFTQEDQAKKAEISMIDRRQNVIYELSVHFHKPLSREEALA